MNVKSAMRASAKYIGSKRGSLFMFRHPLRSGSGFCVAEAYNKANLGTSPLGFFFLLRWGWSLGMATCTLQGRGVAGLRRAKGRNSGLNVAGIDHEPEAALAA